MLSLTMLKVLERGKFSGNASCYHLSAYWCPHPLLQLLLEVGRVSVPQSTGDLGHHLVLSSSLSPSSAVLGFPGEAGAVAAGCTEMSWTEVKAVLLCPCMCANWLHRFVSSLFCSWLVERRVRNFSCYYSCAPPA